MRVRVDRSLQDTSFVVVALVSALLLCRWFSAHRIFWSDELFGWMLLADPSFHHMLTAWRAGADGGGILFYLLGRCWFALFGPSELSFRCFSATGVAGGAIAVWFAARRHYAPWLLATVLLTIWFGTSLTLTYLIEGRFYGMLLGTAGLAYLAAVHAWSVERPRSGTLIFLFVANLLLVGSHPFGGLYCAALLCGMLPLDLAEHRIRWRNYVAAAVPGVLILAVSQQALRNTAAVGRPHFWTRTPHLQALQQEYLLESRLIYDLLVAGALLLAVMLATRWLPWRQVVEAMRGRRVLLLPAAALALCPLAVYAISQRGTSLFVPRYLLPFDIAIAIGMVELWTLILSSQHLRIHGRKLLSISFVAVCLAGLVRSWRPFREQMIRPPRDIVTPLAALFPANLPVIVERADVVDLLWAYAPDHRASVLFPLDWEVALSPDSPPGDVSGFHELQNWGRLGWFSGSIVDSTAFLASINEFVVVDSPEEKWFEQRILANPAQWSAKQLASFAPQSAVEQKNWGETVWLVKRRQAALLAR